MANKGFTKSPFFTFGLPLVLLTVAGSVGIREFAALRIDAKKRKAHKLSTEEIDALTQRERKNFSIKDEYTRLQDKININEWENKRVPRPEEK
eukprot:m.142823 g.142823  ORF g.142823 m.142823 type:complete len:93 (+) comp14889_c0_seq3:297-575(+)